MAFEKELRSNPLTLLDYLLTSYSSEGVGGSSFCFAGVFGVHRHEANKLVGLHDFVTEISIHTQRLHPRHGSCLVYPDMARQFDHAVGIAAKGRNASLQRAAIVVAYLRGSLERRRWVGRAGSKGFGNWHPTRIVLLPDACDQPRGQADQLAQHPRPVLRTTHVGHEPLDLFAKSFARLYCVHGRANSEVDPILWTAGQRG